jgi:hypothetical protein
MSKLILLGAGKSYDTNKQVVEKNQIIQLSGYDGDKYVVYDIVSTQWGIFYKLINLRTKKFGQCNLNREKYSMGEGYYKKSVPLHFLLLNNL